MFLSKIMSAKIGMDHKWLYTLLTWIYVKVHVDLCEARKVL